MHFKVAPGRAWQDFRRPLASFTELADLFGLFTTLGVYILVLAKLEPILSVRLAAAYQALSAASGFTMPLITAALLDQGLAEIRAALDAEVFAAAWEQGRSLSVQQALAEAQAAAERLQATTQLDAD